MVDVLPSPSPRPWRRILLAALLPVEILALTGSFEPSRLLHAAGWLGGLVESSSVLLRVAIAMAATLLLILSPRAGELAERFGADPRPFPWEWTVAHLILYAGLYRHTGWLFSGGSGGPLEGHILAWAALCLAVGLSWSLLLAPFRQWRGLLLAERGAAIASLAAGIAVWLFGLAAQRFWRPLAEWTLFFAHGLLRLVYPNVEYDPAQGTIGTHRLLIEIAPECSGYEGLALVTVFVAVYLWLFRDRMAFPKAFWLLPVGLVAMWLANVVRIAALVVVGTALSPAVAEQGFHSQAGWIAFTAIALALVAVSHRTGLLVKGQGAAGAREAPLAEALLLPLVALLATSMVTAAFSSGFDLLYPAGVLVTAAVLHRYRRLYREMPFGFSWVPVGIGVAVFAAWIGLAPAQPGGTAASPASAPDLPAAWLALWVAFRLAGSVVTVPIAEELAFRGYLLRKLVSRDFEQVPPSTFTWFSFVASSVLFGLLHQSWFAGTLAGVAFAGAVYHRGRLTDAIVAHATANALIAACVLGFGRWELWI